MKGEEGLVHAAREIAAAIERAYEELWDKPRDTPATEVMMAAWRPLAALLERRPGLKLRAVDARMKGESLSVFLADLLGWFDCDLRRDEALVPVLREVSELILARVSDDDPILRTVARAAWVRALDWSDETLGAEAELAAWVHDEPGCASAWSTWSALHFEADCVEGDHSDPERARALLEQGLRHVTDLGGRESLLCQLGNLLGRMGQDDEARAAHDAAMELHEVLCHGRPLTRGSLAAPPMSA